MPALLPLLHVLCGPEGEPEEHSLRHVRIAPFGSPGKRRRSQREPVSGRARPRLGCSCPREGRRRRRPSRARRDTCQRAWCRRGNLCRSLVRHGALRKDAAGMLPPVCVRRKGVRRPPTPTPSPAPRAARAMRRPRGEAASPAVVQLPPRGIVQRRGALCRTAGEATRQRGVAKPPQGIAKPPQGVAKPPRRDSFPPRSVAQTSKVLGRIPPSAAKQREVLLERTAGAAQSPAGVSLPPRGNLLRLADRACSFPPRAVAQHLEGASKDSTVGGEAARGAAQRTAGAAQSPAGVSLLPRGCFAIPHGSFAIPHGRVASLTGVAASPAGCFADPPWGVEKETRGCR